MKKGNYRHYKGGIYEVLGVALHTETEEDLVIYQNMEGRIFARPKTMFEERVEHAGEEMPRFTYLGS